MLLGMIRRSGSLHPSVPLFLTVPHSGEQIPPEAGWLKAASELTLLTDVDRFVEQLYLPAARELPLPLLAAQIHRYAVDLNRFPEDIDADSVQGATTPAGNFTRGFHWVETTTGVRLMKSPIERQVHDELVRKYHDPFHEEIAREISDLRSRFPKRAIYHLDCHSMPSVGNAAHRDGGAERADVVISDVEGKSASESFKDIVVGAFRRAGFEVSYNWPYMGGRITQRYGNPAQGHHTIQIELNRSLYMDETTRARLPEFDSVSAKLAGVLREIVGEIQSIR